MSRSLGLREDQRLSDVLLTRILQLLPDEVPWRLREQACSHKDYPEPVGASMLAKRPEQSAKI